MSATRYHISEDGNPRPCNAVKQSCPIGGEAAHYGSEQEARQAYEVTQTALQSMESDWKMSAHVKRVPEDSLMDKHQVAHQVGPYFVSTRPASTLEGERYFETIVATDNDPNGLPLLERSVNTNEEAVESHAQAVQSMLNRYLLER